jgi:hypothetical protein
MSQSAMLDPSSLRQGTPALAYSALEQYLLDTLRNRFWQGATIADLAHATGLPLGTVRMGLQWLFACGLVDYHGDSYRLVG